MGDTMIWHTYDDGRRTVRECLGRIGTIVAKPGATPYYCFIMDESGGRVRVGTRSDFEMPSKFILRHTGREARYKVIWRDGRQVGAERVSRDKRLPHVHERAGQAA